MFLNLKRPLANLSKDFVQSVDWECPFVIGEGEKARYVDDFVPSVYFDKENDIEIEGDGWEALTGYTGQYAYSGAILHPSEFMGGRLLQDIIETPGTYAITYVLDLDDLDANVGWVVLRKKEK